MSNGVSAAKAMFATKLQAAGPSAAVGLGLLAGLGLVDSSGTDASAYTLGLDDSILSWSGFWGGLVVPIVWTIGILLGGYAIALKRLVVESQPTLDALSHAWERLLAPIYAHFPPLALAALGLVMVLYATLVRRSTATTGEKVERVAVGVVLTAAVGVLAMDPLWPVRAVLSAALGLADDATAALTPNTLSALGTLSQTGPTPHSAVTSDVDVELRAPTLLVSYRSMPSAECVDTWSKTRAGTASPGSLEQCLTQAQQAASHADPTTVFLALGGAFAQVAYAMFVAVVIIKFATHLVTAALRLGTLLYVAFTAIASAHSLERGDRSSFDRLFKWTGKAVGHATMAGAMAFLSVAWPALLRAFAEEIASEVSWFGAVFALALLAAGHWYGRILLIRVSEQVDPLGSFFAELAKSNKIAALLYPPKHTGPSLLSGVLGHVAAAAFLPAPVRTAATRIAGTAAKTRQRVDGLARQIAAPFAPTRAPGPGETAFGANNAVAPGHEPSSSPALRPGTVHAPSVDAATELYFSPEPALPVPARQAIDTPPGSSWPPLANQAENAGSVSPGDRARPTEPSAAEASARPDSTAPELLPAGASPAPRSGGLAEASFGARAHALLAQERTRLRAAVDGRQGSEEAPFAVDEAASHHFNHPQGEENHDESSSPFPANRPGADTRSASWRASALRIARLVAGARGTAPPPAELLGQPPQVEFARDRSGSWSTVSALAKGFGDEH